MIKSILYSFVTLLFTSTAFGLAANVKMHHLISLGTTGHSRSTGNVTTISLNRYFNRIGAYDLDRLEVTKLTIPGHSCGDSYFVDITARGFWHYVQSKVDFYVQTLSKQNQDRIYNAIQANYSVKGLPACLLQDKFYLNYITAYSYHYSPDQTTVLLPVKAQSVPKGYPCAGSIMRPITTCWNVQNLYGK